MTYISQLSKRQLHDWIMAEAMKIGRRVVTPSIQSVFGTDDAEVVAATKMLSLAEAGASDRPFLYRSGYNAAVDACRQVASRQGNDFVTSTDETGLDVADTVDEQANTLRGLMIGELLATLSERDERVIRAIYLEGRSEREVAATEDVSHERINQIKSRSLLRLRKEAENSK